MRTTFAVVTALAAWATIAVVVAHHAPVAFDLSNKMVVTGTLTKIDWRNPHIELSLTVPPATPDQPTEWRIEGHPPSTFRQRNISKEQFLNMIGQTLTVNGFRAKDGSAFLLMETVTFPDGRTVVVR